jgi:hypothetical protein
MNYAIAQILNTYLATLPFADRMGGVVKAVTFLTGSDDKPIKKTIPVDCGVSQADCMTGKYQDLIPNSKYKSISYFEDGGVKLLSINERDYSFQSNLRLIFWLNLKKTGKTDCNVSALAVTNVLNKFPQTPFSSGIYSRMRIKVNQEIVKSAAIFSKYTYDEAVTQYLMYPFDYFALDITTDFLINKSCIIDWENETPIICEPQ